MSVCRNNLIDLVDRIAFTPVIFIRRDHRGDASDQEWGLNKGMELFEVSAKDDFGM